MTETEQKTEPQSSTGFRKAVTGGSLAKSKRLSVTRRECLRAAARVAFLASLLIGTEMSAAGGDSQTLRGQVLGGGKPLAGVLVSDGCRVARTNTRGDYELAIGPDSGRFVFVTTPRGYWADVFYVPIGEAAAKGRADFALRPVDQPDRFDFVFITDMHVDSHRHGVPKFKASIREINDLTPTPAFLWAQGDICLEGRAGKDYTECLTLAKMPVRNGPGNHEVILAHKNPFDEFEQLFGPTYFSFDWGAVHCIVLNGNKPMPGEQGYKSVHGAIEGSEMKWLRADLAAQPRGKVVIVGVHIPIVSTYRERRHEIPKHAPCWKITNDRELTALFAMHGVRLVLQGHMHENERVTVQGVEYVESIALSGGWGKSGEGLERGVDGTPRGYRIVSVNGKKISHRYQSSCESRVTRQGEFVGIVGRALPDAKAEFAFNCYDAPNGSKAQARIDNGPWRPMPAHFAVNEFIGLKMPHHFRFVTDTTRLKAGPHTIEARVAWPEGTVVTEKETFILP